MRKYSTISKEDFHSVEYFLNLLIDKSTNINDYRKSFNQLGKLLGKAFLSLYPEIINGKRDSAMLVCASEDADWLASGFLDGCNYRSMPISVLWTKRHKLSNGSEFASIIKTYEDRDLEFCESVIIIKSIISSSCIVKTQLLRLLSYMKPSNIFIISPVMYKDAPKNLTNEFPENVANKFKFLTFAIDDVVTANNEVVPGIGGYVYPRLGLGDSSDKNAYMPQLVLNRLDL